MSTFPGFGQPWIAPWFASDDLAATRNRLPVTLLAVIIVTGLWLRFHGLGTVGIYSDEKYTFLAALGILDSGLPMLPGDMLYPRAMLQSYMMAGSVWLFGESAWAFRLPSVLGGVVCIPVAWLLGRHYLTPILNLAFTAVFALLPVFIEVSRIARMYGFLVLMVCLFLLAMTRWQRTASWTSLAAATLIVLVALEFQVIAVFLAPLLLVPVLVQPSGRRFVQASVALTAIAVGYLGITRFVRWQYGESLAAEISTSRHPTGLEAAGIQHLPWEMPVVMVTLTVVGLLLATAGKWSWGRSADSGVSAADARFRAPGAACLGGALVCGAVMVWLPAALLYLAGGIMSRRGTGHWRGSLLAGGVLLFMSGYQAVWVLYTGTADNVSGFVKLFVAFPSPTPELRFLAFFPAAIALFAMLTVGDLFRFARGEPLKLYILLLAAGVVLPMLVMGAMRWSVAPRYLLGLMPVFLLCFFMALRHLLDRLPMEGRLHASACWIASAAAVIMLVPPGALSQVLDRNYGRYPDHEGAAHFVQSRGLAASDVIIVLDAPMQTYLLGEVDYLLRRLESGAWQTRRVDGQMVDIFTGTPVLSDARAFRRVLERDDRGTAYVIGSGEVYTDHALDRVVGPEMLALFQSHGAELVFTGRDGRTRVWKFAEPASESASARDGNP